MQIANEAKVVLLDPRSRRIYNSQLHLHMLRENAALRASVDILYIYK